jgi:hypothetical protein
MGQVEAENRIAGLDDCAVGLHVGLRSSVWLDVGILRPKQSLGAVASQILHNVGIFAAAVVTPAGVALGIFVGEDGARCLKHRLGDKVLTGNHLQPLVLAESFMVKGSGYSGVGLGEGHGYAVSHKKDSSRFYAVGDTRNDGTD